MLSDRYTGTTERGLAAYRVRTIGAVNEDSASFHFIPKLRSACNVSSPDARCKSVVAVVHEVDSLLITLDLHHWDNWTECLRLHDFHVVSDIDQDFGCDVAARLRQGHE